MWSTEAVEFVSPATQDLNMCSRVIPGIVRFPKNLIRGVRSACAPAAEARRTLVANIFAVGYG